MRGTLVGHMHFASLALLLSSLLPVKGLLPVLDDLGVWEGIDADDYIMKDGVGAFIETTPQPTTNTLPTQTTSNNDNTPTRPSQASSNNGNTPTRPSQASSNNGSTRTRPSQATSNNGNGNTHTTATFLTSSTNLPFTTFFTTQTDPNMTLPMTEIMTDAVGNEIVVDYDTETTTTRLTSDGIVFAQEIVTRVPRTTITRTHDEYPIAPTITTVNSQPTGTTIWSKRSFTLI